MRKFMNQPKHMAFDRFGDTIVFRVHVSNGDGTLDAAAINLNELVAKTQNRELMKMVNLVINNDRRLKGAQE